MTSNEKWQGGSDKRSSGAGRDGKPFEKRDVKSILKGTRGAAKYPSNQPYERSGNNERPESRNDDDSRPRFKATPSKGDRPEGGAFGNKPRFNPNSERGNSYGDKPRFNSNPDRGNSGSDRGNSYGDKPRFNSNSEGGQGFKPRFNSGSEGGSFGNKPRFNSNPDRGNSYGDKPRFNSNSERGNSYGDKPRFNNNPEGGQGFKPRFNSGTEGGSYSPRPRFNPRPDGDSDSRPRFSPRKTEEEENANYIETRFDNSAGGRRPRIRINGNVDPNAKYSKKKQLEFRKSDIDLTKPVRLNKFLANAGICSRREADEYISAGVITVNGEFVTEMGIKVMYGDKVMFHNQLVRSERKVYILLNKPKDTVTTAEDTHDRRTVMDLVKNACSERIYPVGRLDRNTTGVLLLTNDGDLASRLTHPKYNKKKIYHVVLDKPLQIPDFEQIMEGVTLDDEKIAADALNFVKDDDLKQIGIEIHSGQNRVVRRIFEKLGYKVVRLDRVYFSGLTKKNLPRGKYRFLSEREISMLKMGAYE